LKELQQTTHEEFLESKILQGAVEHFFQVSIQAALDIGSMILSDKSTDVPGEYREIFPELAKFGIIPKELSEKLVGMAKFRNVLVYLYLDVDIDFVYQYLQHNLGDLETFTRCIGEYLGRSTP